MLSVSASFKSPRLGRTLAAAVVGLMTASQARALDARDFVVADDDGYGVADCMKPGATCGGVIADAWCEAHGHGHASAFGLADDVTGSTTVKASAPSATLANTVIIRCDD